MTVPPLSLLPMPEDWQRALVIVAHPDDAEWGTATAIAGWTSAGKQVAYVLATRGEAGIDTLPPERAGPLREAEQRAAAAEVGVHGVEFLGLPDGVLEYGPVLRRALTLAIRRHRPELVVTINHHEYWGPGSPNSPDHRVVGQAAIDAATDAGNRWIWPPTEGEPGPWRVRWVAVSSSPLASHAVDISARRDRGIASLAAHRSYLLALSDEPPEQHAARLIDELTASDPDIFDGRSYLSFELLTL
ncbi:MAG TPA: PIG-L deacetylase family protein [Pseudonocardia sp.]|jgi:LmbE family N-acetylglucosaminyl deacetylase|nr:PIG-L deacetylase family protein [Pseudonocardia sp.]